jgi:uncharacterized membrane protein affecting hemolysin expression
MLFWLSLAVGLVLIVGAIVYATMQGLALWRLTKQVSRSAGEELDRIARASAEIELQLQAAAVSGTSLDASLVRLSRSRARLNVLTSALADVRSAVGRVTAVYPRK